jgi:hypothetical protein
LSEQATAILAALGNARRFADPDSPVKARLMAAAGALPIPPAQLAGVLVALTYDPEPQVREKAGASLDALPAALLDQVLGAALHPAVLDWFAHHFAEDETRLEQVALNPATSDETFCFLASRPFPRLLDTVSRNQVRLLRCEALVDVLGSNSLTPQSTIDRILHFLGVERAPTEEPPPDALDGPEPPPPALGTDGADGAVPEIDLSCGSDLPPELVEEAEVDAKQSEAEIDEQRASLYARVQEMTVMEKLKLARFGNSEARAILVRDRNRIVATSAIRSPKLSEQEVISFAKARNLCDDVYRIIANTRAWTRNYQVKLALATNVRTPQGTAIKFLNYLTDRDLRTIMRSRDVPGQVAQGARRLLMKKGKL